MYKTLSNDPLRMRIGLFSKSGKVRIPTYFKYLSPRARWLLQHGDRNETDCFRDNEGWYVLMYAPSGEMRIYLPQNLQERH